MLKLSMSASHSCRSERVLRQPEAGAGAVSLVTDVSYLSWHALSHPSSTVSSASFPDARVSWHLKTHFWYLLRIFATLLSYLRLSASGGMNPVSSPPNGVTAQAPP